MIDAELPHRPGAGAQYAIPLKPPETGNSRLVRFEVNSQFPDNPIAPRVVSLKLDDVVVKSRSYFFSPAPSPLERRKQAAIRPGQSLATIRPNQKKKTVTRIKPPGDVIKLQDRLYFALQPPLETIIANGAIEFPFEPFPYQFTGVAFLFPRHSAILADEMGLGKTMQAITSIRLLLHAGQLRQVLLICPKPLVTNWVREFAMWAPEIPLCVVQGDRANRTWQWRDAQLPVTIANYELMTRDIDILHEDQLDYDLVVLDEAQRIKNRNGATNQAVCSIQRKRNWALTGTPIENSTEDLVGIFEFLSSGYLRPDMTVKALRKSVRDHILRRTKTEVLTDMPPLLHRDAVLALTPDQQETYGQAESEGVIRLNELGHEITIQHVFELVLRLKQICNFDPATGESAKLERLQAELAEVIASGQKAIVFSQWVKTIGQIAERIPEANPLEYHGKISPKYRNDILDDFREDPDRHVLLMSYGAGSVGLNLQICRYVFLFDQWWNPAVEDQAINRAHRIGSTGSVTVTRMISEGTIEERINQILQSKRELFESILSGAGQPAQQGLSREEIFGLFELKAAGKPLGNFQC